MAWRRLTGWPISRGSTAGSVCGAALLLATQWAIADQLPSPPRGRSADDDPDREHGYSRHTVSRRRVLSCKRALLGRSQPAAEEAWPDSKALQRGVDGFPLIERTDRAGGDIPFFDDWVTHSARDELARHRRRESRCDASGTGPADGGWFDLFLPGQLADFVRIRRQARGRRERHPPRGRTVGPRRDRPSS